MKVSVIISNRNDLTMLSITVRSVLEALEMVPDSEVVVCDNSDKEKFDVLNSFLPYQYVRDEKVRVIRQNFPCLFTARETAIRESRGDYVLCLDSHMLVGHGMIADLVSFMDQQDFNEKMGFAHAPINWCHQHFRHSKADRNMQTCELGDWGSLYDCSRKITWKGMPWICRKQWFIEHLRGYGALSQHKLSWGGGDMHIGIKPWLLGYENWFVSTRPGIHIGPFPGRHDSGHPYRLYSTSGNYPACLGFLVSCYVLGGEDMMKRNEKAIAERFDHFNVRAHWGKAKELGHEEREWMLSNQKISFDELLKRQPWNS